MYEEHGLWWEALVVLLVVLVVGIAVWIVAGMKGGAG